MHETANPPKKTAKKAKQRNYDNKRRQKQSKPTIETKQLRKQPATKT